MPTLPHPHSRRAVIDWFFAWPADALYRVAENFLREEPLADDVRAGSIAHMVHVHQSVVVASKRFADVLRRHNYVTPKNYLDFIANYRSQSAYHKKVITARVRRLEGGLTKLGEAQTAVDKMSVELTEQKVIVDAKTKDVEKMISDIGQRQAIADRQQADAQTKQKELGVNAKIIAEESERANKALEAAIPALEAAANALENLDKDDISELKGFASPPVSGDKRGVLPRPAPHRTAPLPLCSAAPRHDGVHVRDGAATHGQGGRGGRLEGRQGHDDGRRLPAVAQELREGQAQRE